MDIDIQKEIDALKERNKRVEADKAWETSPFRMATIAVITYIVACVLLYILGVPSYFLSALVPAAGYILSAQTLPPIKRWWVRTIYNSDSIR